jgi:anthranilate phosphoribosyltransferase
MTSPSSAAMPYALGRLRSGAHLTAEESAAAFDVLMRGEASAAEIAGLLTALRALGETAEEIAGAAAALRRAMIPLPPVPGIGADRMVDTCGTGGGMVPTFNISTAAAFVVAGAGVPVAKHGNRSFTSKSGSADVLEALGVPIDLTPEAAARALGRAGIAFLFAPTYHPAMRHAAPVRRELGVPTMMNLLGPLANPAGVRRQVLGVADRERAPRMARALALLGTEHALVVHGEIGMDELSPVGPTAVWEVREGMVREWAIDPAALGLGPCDPGSLRGGTPAENGARIRGILEGGHDPAGRAAVLLNAAAALYVAGRARNFADAYRAAGTVVDSGAAAERLELLRTVAGQVSTSGAPRPRSPG